MGFFNLFGKEDNSSTTQNTSYQTNNTSNTDNSKMFGDNGFDMGGNGNSWFDGSNRSTSFSDSSNRSTNFSDSSNRSTNFSDSSDRSYSGNSGSFNSTSFADNSVRTYTDFGSVGAALGVASNVGGAAVTGNVNSTMSALDSVKYQAQVNAAGIDKAFKLAENVAGASERTAAQILGFAGTAANLPTNSSTQKTADAKEQFNKYALIAAAVVVGLYVMKKA